MRRLTLLLAVLAAPAAAQGWFLHPFGELRAYHGDFLSVCADDGAGPCRTVQTYADPGSEAFFDTRLAVHRLDVSPGWVVEIMDRGMPDRVDTLRVTIDGEVWDVAPEARRRGGHDLAGVAETVTITGAALNAALVAAMRAGNRMTVRYAPESGGDGEARFSLRGFTAATDAIDARALPREE